MATTQIEPGTDEVEPARLSPAQRTLTWIREHALAAYTLLALFYMFLPVAVVVVFSFNKPIGRQNTRWNEFSLDAWLNICKDPTICGSVQVSATIAFFATLVGTIMGTMIAFRKGR